MKETEKLEHNFWTFPKQTWFLAFLRKAKHDQLSVKISLKPRVVDMFARVFDARIREYWFRFHLSRFMLLSAESINIKRRERRLSVLSFPMCKVVYLSFDAILGGNCNNCRDRL